MVNRRADAAASSDGYKWLVLSNTTLASLLATIDASITVISMPDIFRGIKLDPLAPANSFYLLWMVLGYSIVGAVLIVSLGRLGDMFGRVRIYRLGYVIYTIASLLATIDWLTGRAGADYLIVLRFVQGIGGACLMANAAAIVTDTFPQNQRGLALGLTNIMSISGTFIGLLLGGLLAPINWRLIFLVSVPFGLFGTVWAYLKLHELGTHRRARVDWLGNITFAAALVCILISITYGIRPYGTDPTGWTSPRVLSLLGAGIALLVAFVAIERRVADPMFRLPLFRIRAFTFGTTSTFLSFLARTGLMFMLVIWLQGIWLPEHGYDFAQTPLWAGIYLLPLTFGILISGPVSGYLTDRFGARPFATGGMLAAALSFGLLILVPTNFSYPVLALVLTLNGIANGMFAMPNRAAVMNSLPPADRGAGAGMNQTFQASAQVVSIGVFFTIMVVGLSGTLPHSLSSGLIAHGVAPSAAAAAAHAPAISVLFSAFLGYNPIAHLLGPHTLATLSAHNRALLSGRALFPHLISAPFRHALNETFAFSIVTCLITAGTSLMRGGHYHAPHATDPPPDQSPQPAGVPAG